VINNTYFTAKFFLQVVGCWI